VEFLRRDKSRRAEFLRRDKSRRVEFLPRDESRHAKAASSRRTPSCLRHVNFHKGVIHEDETHNAGFFNKLNFPAWFSPERRDDGHGGRFRLGGHESGDAAKRPGTRRR
jgi:hypothetical protein